MVNCCVPGCTNYSSKTTNVSYHKIPKDLKLQKAWISRIRRDNMPPLTNCHVCSEHFTDDCFERDLYQELMEGKKKGKLKKDAVPSVFSFASGTCTKRRATSENRIKRQRQQETVENLMASSVNVSEELIDVDGEHNDTCSTQPSQPSLPKTIDIGIQCCLSAHYKITSSTATQTCGSDYQDQAILTDKDSIAEHSYAMQAVSPQKSCISPQKSVRSFGSFLSDDDIQLSDADDDTDYQISSSQETHSSTNSELSEPNTNTFESFVDEPKYLVFLSNLKELFHFCAKCGAVIISEPEFSHLGSMLTVKTKCLNDHENIWSSQPMVNGGSIGNLLICSSILFTGNTYSRLKDFATCLGLHFISEKLFYRRQDKFLFPVINDTWEAERLNTVNQLMSQEEVNLNGDGRCDSPGHNAKYNVYTMMDSDSGKVVTFKLVQVTEVSSSNAMENEGFVRCLDNLEDDDELAVDMITTDRHMSVTSTMEKDYSHIKHQYDVWHLSKSIVKKLNKKAKLKSNKDLAQWIQSISNHLWWCAATCGGSAKLLREKWVSILHHVANKHRWNDAEEFTRCAHPRLTRREVRSKCWLEPGSSAYVALEEIVLQPKLLKDIGKLTEFCHTGGLEVYHSLALKYCPKREHFSYKGMIARAQLAAIDNNCNVNRKQAVIQTGERKGEARYRSCFTKMQKRWISKPIKEKKSFAFLPEMQKKVLKMYSGAENYTKADEVELPANIATKPKPAKHDLIEKHRSRFAR